MSRRCSRHGLASVAFGLVVAVGFALSPSPVRASGLELREQGAISIGRCDAVTARLDDASTVYFNPAGMGFLDGLQISAGLTVVFGDFNYVDPLGTGAKAGNTNSAVTPPHLYLSYRINEMFAVGLSVNVPFGLALEWPEDYPGAHISVGATLQVFLINPTVAIRPLENLSIGVGIQLMPGTVDIKRRLGFVTDAGDLAGGGIHMGGVAFGVGGNLGVMYRPLDWLFLGFFYRSRVKLEFEGDAHFDLPDGLTDRSVFHDQNVKAGATMPDYMTLGIGFQVHERVYLEFDVDYVLWSTVDKITIAFPDDESGQLDKPVPEDWGDIFTLRLGVEWRALDTGNHVMHVRGGVGFDPGPAPDHTLSPLLPDSSRAFGSAGIGYQYRPWRLGIDVGYLFAKFLERTVTTNDCSGGHCNPFPANYDTHAHVLPLDLSWRAF